MSGGNTTPVDYIKEIGERIQRRDRTCRCPADWPIPRASPNSPPTPPSRALSKFPPAQEKEFLKDRPVRELSGIAKNRERALAALGARTFGDVAKLPSMLLKQKFGIWGQQLWLFANGRWNEPLLLEAKDRTTISSNTTLPYDEPDYEAALTFTLSETTRLVGQLRREQLQAREMSLTIRFNDFTEIGRHPSFSASAIPQFRHQRRGGKDFPRIDGQRIPAGAADPHRLLEPVAAGYATHALGQDRGGTLGRAR